MKLLLDTHVLLWTLLDDGRLSKKARQLIGDRAHEKYYSIVSLWEVAIKHLLHPEKMPWNAKSLADYCEQAKMREFPIAKRHVFALGTLKRTENAPPHKDPFDRIMLCQAMEDGMLFLTHDKLLRDYMHPFIVMV